MSVRAQVEPSGALVELMRLLRILRGELFGLEGDEGVGVLREAGRDRFGQLELARRFAQQRFRQLQVEGAGLARELEVFLLRLALAGECVAHALHDELAWRTGGQRAAQRQQGQ